MTSKESYFQELSSFENLEIFIADDIESVSKEIYANALYISYPEYESDLPSVDEFVNLLNRIKENRRSQLKSKSGSISLIYYCWLDEQAGQFRLNFINSNHLSLPFNCTLSFTSEEKLIVENFIHGFRRPEIGWKDLSSENADTEIPDSSGEYVLTVYKEIIE